MSSTNPSVAAAADRPERKAKKSERDIKKAEKESRTRSATTAGARVVQDPKIFTTFSKPTWRAALNFASYQLVKTDPGISVEESWRGLGDALTQLGIPVPFLSAWSKAKGLKTEDTEEKADNSEKENRNGQPGSHSAKRSRGMNGDQTPTHPDETRASKRARGTETAEGSPRDPTVATAKPSPRASATKSPGRSRRRGSEGRAGPSPKVSSPPHSVASKRRERAFMTELRILRSSSVFEMLDVDIHTSALDIETGVRETKSLLQKYSPEASEKAIQALQKAAEPILAELSAHRQAVNQVMYAPSTTGLHAVLGIPADSSDQQVLDAHTELKARLAGAVGAGLDEEFVRSACERLADRFDAWMLVKRERDEKERKRREEEARQQAELERAASLRLDEAKRSVAYVNGFLNDFPEGVPVKHLFEIFGIAPAMADTATIKKTRMKLVRVLHPDKVPDVGTLKSDATNAFKAMKSFEDVLADVIRDGEHQRPPLLFEGFFDLPPFLSSYAKPPLFEPTDPIVEALWDPVRTDRACHSTTLRVRWPGFRYPGSMTGPPEQRWKVTLYVHKMLPGPTNDEYTAAMIKRRYESHQNFYQRVPGDPEAIDFFVDAFPICAHFRWLPVTVIAVCAGGFYAKTQVCLKTPDALRTPNQLTGLDVEELRSLWQSWKESEEILKKDPNFFKKKSMKDLRGLIWERALMDFQEQSQKKTMRSNSN
uniref:J domain-containing protein n=1 Tax=Chromera velia CCMP2878 TaxID=1169474 RepID=A0A0G4HTJ8_9ALVE|eukprot:Cvel_8430.t1-p1 / transcript=Cvel_8430.t1 / gene=Cvel_8430 / organism=Chromera_velia_CCMP2878 / gene_product=hypothetical protein / transcript_product=hypothetical protein / location=Cvel_scaffold465:67491-72492(-) / protein_length=711 / sequence_SO=supercontig / SO=protein_coding / is_pseudo=false